MNAFAQSIEFVSFIDDSDAAVEPPPVPVPYLIEDFASHYWDERDLPDGAVATWTSRDPTHVVLSQGTAGARPTMGAGGVSFDGGDFLVRGAFLPAAAAQTMPQASASAVGKGFTCTGLAALPDGRWAVGNHGKAQSGDPTWAPSIVILSEDMTTVVDEILLAPLFSGFQSVQGVAYDPARNSLWIADLANKMIRQVSLAGVALGGDITLTYAPNGLAIDPAADAIWAYAQAEDPTPSVLQKLSLVDGSVLQNGSLVLSNHDHLHYIAETKTMLVSSGANGTSETLRFYAAPAGAAWTLQATITVTEARAIEGIAWRDGRLYVMDDAYFHGGGASVNQVLIYEVPYLVANVIDLFGIITVPASTGVDAIFCCGNPLPNNTHGWALYTNGSTDLRLFAQQSATATQASVIATPTPSLLVPRQWYGRIDLTANTISIWVDGTLVLSGSAAAIADGGLSAVPEMRMGASVVGDRQATIAVKALGCYVGGGDRVRTEGRLAHDFALTGDLDMAHPYKLTPPMRAA